MHIDLDRAVSSNRMARREDTIVGCDAWRKLLLELGGKRFMVFYDNAVAWAFLWRLEEKLPAVPA